jgi:integrase
MTRPVQPIGTFGTIAVKKVRERTFYASTRFRAYNGGYIRFSATAATDRAAQRELKRKLADYTEAQKADGINSLSPLSDVAAIWLHEVSTAGRLSPQTIDAYADNLRAVLLPDLGKMRLSELTVGVLDRYFKQLAVDHPSRARRGKIVLSQIMALAVRHDAIRANPVQMTGPLKKPQNEVKVLNVDELTHTRRIIAEWRTASTVMGPKPDGQLALIFDVILGTGARIGEALAIRACDIDFSAHTVTISGTIVPHRGSGLVRQNHPKHTKSWRTVTVPSFVVAALKTRWAIIDTTDPDCLVFQTRNSTILSPANVRRQWRSIRAGREDLPANIDLGQVTPHVFRKTAADAVDKKVGTRIAADMLGHSSTAVTEQYYVRPVKHVDPSTADALQSLGPAQPRPLLPPVTQTSSPGEAVPETRPAAYRP